jgi:hypothetical protein
VLQTLFVRYLSRSAAFRLPQDADTILSWVEGFGGRNLHHRRVSSAASLGFITKKKDVLLDQGSCDNNSMSEVDLLFEETGTKFFGTKRI